MHSGLCCGLFRGSFFARDLSNPAAALLPLGNAEATITQALTEINQPNYESLGGNACSVAYVDSVGLDLILHCTAPENLAIAFMGTTSQLAGGTVASELHMVRAIEELIPFNYIPSKSSPITVKNSAATTTYVLNTDYIVTNSGIQIIEGSSIPMNAQVNVGYSYGENFVVEAQTVAQKTFEIVLDGVNVGEDGEKPVVIRAWRVKLSPAENFALISGTDFASLELSGEILRDNSRPTGSKFFKAEFGIEASGSY